MTNREWLNSLNDEEFAKELNNCKKFCITKGSCCDCINCEGNTIKWLKQERKEPIKLSDVERVILENIDKKYKWIVRDKFKDRICIYKEKPMIGGDVWNDVNQEWTCLDCYNHLFQFIQWEDEEPYNIEELLEQSNNELVEDKYILGKKGKCNDCGKIGTYQYEPYELEIHDEKIIICLCDNCKHERADNI